MVNKLHETWKIVERLEQLADQIEALSEAVEGINKVNIAFNRWINEATASIGTITKDIEYLKHKKDCI